MVIFDEMHTVTVTVAGVAHRVATANLNGDVDTVASLRSRASRSHLIDVDADAVGAAFDRAFEACERIPGDGASDTVEGEGFSLTVRRSLEG